MWEGKGREGFPYPNCRNAKLNAFCTMAEVIRRICFRDTERYIELLRLGFVDGPAREETAGGLVRAARLYRHFFIWWRCLSLLNLFRTIVPEILVCEKEGTVAGIMGVRRIGYNNGPFQILHTVVDPAFRRQGIASRLYGHFERSLDTRKDHVVLSKVRENNIPQIRNRHKTGFHNYAKEMRFDIDLASFRSNVRCEKETSREDSCSSVATYSAPTWAEMRELKFKEMPARVRDFDPVAAFPFGSRPNLSAFLNNAFVARPRWKGGIVRHGQVTACGILIYHRLQHTYELEISALPDSEDSTDMLLRNLARDLSCGPKSLVTAIVRDYQKTVIRVFERFGLSAKTRHLLFSRKLKRSLATQTG